MKKTLQINKKSISYKTLIHMQIIITTVNNMVIIKYYCIIRFLGNRKNMKIFKEKEPSTQALEKDFENFITNKDNMAVSNIKKEEYSFPGQINTIDTNNTQKNRSSYQKFSDNSPNYGMNSNSKNYNNRKNHNAPNDNNMGNVIMMNQQNYIQDENFNNIFFPQYNNNNQNPMLAKQSMGNNENQNYDNNDVTVDGQDNNLNRGRNKRSRNGLNM